TTLNARDQPPAEVSDQRVSGLTGAVQSATEPALGKSVPRTSQGYAKRPRSILTCRPPPANQHSATTRQRGTQCSLPVSAPSPACLC
ncbi:hypothetical protein FHI80_16840, partial [Mycobacterium orygis]